MSGSQTRQPARWPWQAQAPQLPKWLCSAWCQLWWKFQWDVDWCWFFFANIPCFHSMSLGISDRPQNWTGEASHGGWIASWMDASKMVAEGISSWNSQQTINGLVRENPSRKRSAAFHPQIEYRLFLQIFPTMLGYQLVGAYIPLKSIFHFHDLFNSIIIGFMA